MLTVTDSGCRFHQPRHLTLMGEEAEVMAGVLHNLPQTAGGSFYVCEHGHSHSVSFNNDRFNFERVPESIKRCSVSR